MATVYPWIIHEQRQTTVVFVQADERFATGLTELSIGQFGITLCSYRVNMLAQQRISRYELASPQCMPKTLTVETIQLAVCFTKAESMSTCPF